MGKFLILYMLAISGTFFAKKVMPILILKYFKLLFLYYII